MVGYNPSTYNESIKVFFDVLKKKQVTEREDTASIKRLNDIAELPYDWNGYGAIPFSKVLINKCKRIVNNLSVSPYIYPTGRQSIQFQYELKDRSYLEFEIFENKTMCLIVPKRIYDNAKETTITESEDKKIEEIVDNFYGNVYSKK